MELELEFLWSKIEKYAERLNEIKLNNKTIFLFGAGMNGSFTLECLRENYQIYGFLDNFSQLWGTQKDGLMIFSTEEVKKYNNSIVIISTASKNYKAVKNQLESLNIECITWFEYQLCSNLDKMRCVYEMLYDSFSKRTYLNLILAKVTGEQEYRNQIFCPNQYFALPEFNIPMPQEVFVDCGAYVGDTVETYVKTRMGSFGKVIAFEPNEQVWPALEKRRNRLIEEWSLRSSDIVIEKKAIGRCGGTGCVQLDGHGNITARVDEGGSDIEINSLDEYLTTFNQNPLFIKVDIEGGEKNLIYGAEHTIRTKKPAMAISVYHKAEDIYELPIIIKTWNSSYKMSIRSHMPDDTDIVLYCY